MRGTSLRISLLALFVAGAASCSASDGINEDLSGDVDAPGAPTLAMAGSMGSEEEVFATRFWFVELNTPALAAGGDQAAIRKDKHAFRTEAARAGLKYTERHAFDNLWNGFSVEIDPKDRALLQSLRPVKTLFPVLEVEQDLATATAMTSANIVHNTAPTYFKGEGIKVAVIDSGIDYHHKELGSCFGPGCHVAFGHDFVGDAFNSANPVLMPDNDPDDCGGHGSHVAGIIGADRTLKGVAPKVTLGAYRVFGCSGSTLSDVMVAAMEKAQQDGAHVVNMSIGSAFWGWKQYPTSVAADNLVTAGVVVVTSGGNSGASGVFATGSPGAAEKVISNAMFDNTHSRLPFGALQDGSRAGYATATGSPPAPTSGSGTLAKNGTPSTPNDACNANLPPPGSLTGKIALIRRGSAPGGPTCGFYEKARNAEKDGAIGVILYNNVAGRINPTVAPPTGADPALKIPVIAISDVEGVALNNLIEAGQTQWTWTDQIDSFLQLSGKLLNGDSSYGPSAELDMKPDLGAPGGQIYSTIPLEQGGYAVFNGTSMASPHTAGAVALFLQAHPGTSPAEVRDALQNTAEPMLWSGNPASNQLDVVHRQGAGMINIAKAINAPARVSPGKLALGEDAGQSMVRTLTVKNLTNNPIEYTLSHQPAVSTTAVDSSTKASTSATNNALAFNLPTNSSAAPATVTFSAPTVVVPPNSTASFDVTITAHANLPQRGLYGGWIKLTDANGGKLSVPYQALKGDYQMGKVLGPTAWGFPWLASSANGSYSKIVNGGTVFSLQNGQIPYILAHFDYQARTFRISAISRTGVNMGVAYEQEYMGRNSTSGGFSSFSWDGKVEQNGQLVDVPNGQYYLKVEVLKPLGDESNPNHWEVWTTPNIAIMRP
jgi:subtilisin family serine protease